MATVKGTSPQPLLVDIASPRLQRRIHMMTHASGAHAIDHHHSNKTIDVLAADILKTQLIKLAHALQSKTNVRRAAGLFEHRFQKLPVQAIRAEMDAMCVGHIIKIKQRAQAFESAPDTQDQVECAFVWSQLNWIVNKNAAMTFSIYGCPRVLLHWIAGGQ